MLRRPLEPMAPGFLDLWIADSRELGAIPRSAAELLDEPDRRELSCRGAADTRPFLLSRLILRLALSRRAGRDPSAWRFETTELGRPRLAGDSGGLEFSISHAGDCVAVALSDRSVGLDVEAYGADPAGAACCLAAEELARLRQLPPERRSRDFTALWTAKEAYSKLLGFGVNRELSEITADEISRATYATAFSLPGRPGHQVTLLTARRNGPAPAAGVHFLRPGSLSLIGAVSARTAWVPTPVRAGRKGSGAVEACSTF